MKILFDQGVPVPLRTYLAEHEFCTAYEIGWSTLKNGDLMDAAEREKFDAFVTTDQCLEHQQNLTGRVLRILVLPTTAWPRIQEHVSTIVAEIDRLPSGSIKASYIY